MTTAIYLTIVVPVRNEESCISQTLEAFAAQDYPEDRYEILVVDGQSTDRTRDIVEEFSVRRPGVNLRLLDNPGRWSSRARNIGVRAARGKLIAVIDGHVDLPSNQLFTAIERLTEQQQALCLSRPAPLVVPSLDDGMPLWIALARQSWLGHSRVSYIYRMHEGFVDPLSAGFAYDRRVFNRVGYFDESFDAAEDVEFHHRLKKAGILAYTSPALTIYSYPRATLRGLFQQMTRYGVGRARFVQKHPDASTKETMIPPGIFLYFAVLPVAMIAAWLWPLVGLGYFVGLGLYGAMVLAASVAAVLPRKRLGSAHWVAAAIWTTHMGLGWGFLKSILRHQSAAASPPARQALSEADPPQGRRIKMRLP